VARSAVAHVHAVHALRRGPLLRWYAAIDGALCCLLHGATATEGERVRVAGGVVCSEDR